MTFDLSPSLISSIIFSMEDQTSVRLLDALEGKLVVVKEGGKESSEYVKADNDRYYSLPEWTSADGYSLLEDFTESLKADEYKNQLKSVLVNGRGVFRNFKNVIKSSQQLQRQWNIFKSARMKERLLEWYNALRENWGLDSYEMQSDDFDTEDLLFTDFAFDEYDPQKDREDFIREREEVFGKLKEECADFLEESRAFVWQKFSLSFDGQEKKGFVCRTSAGDFAACLLCCPVSFSEKNGWQNILLTDFFVVESYRNLGIAKEMLFQCMQDFREGGAQRILILNFMVPQFMLPVLTGFGFVKQGNFLVADLTN